MPEGDSIVRLARRLRPALGEEPLRVSAPHPRGRLAGVGALDGRRLERIDTHGKHLLLRFEGELVLHSHIAMTGRWGTFRPESVGERTLRAAWIVLEGGPKVVAEYRGPTLRVLTALQARGDLRLRSLGPDALAPDFDPGHVLRRIRRGAQDRALADVLLDQRLIAGPGLIYASEGPAAARLHPLELVGTLSDQCLLDVIAATRDLMLEAVESGRQPKTVQSRKGKPCLRCGSAIEGAAVGDHARRAYWCPACQPRLRA
ncbi:MAG: DNA-formamidopyrimidine glycosylase family protein [Solirubrobacteraceae bacterium]|nr:DNA-formamidopyrimidine glycosylase family protein [Solirubrobacteraceae bacterium]